MSFSSIFTSYGLAKIAEAQAMGTTINLTHMAVGGGITEIHLNFSFSTN